MVDYFIKEKIFEVNEEGVNFGVPVYSLEIREGGGDFFNGSADGLYFACACNENGQREFIFGYENCKTAYNAGIDFKNIYYLSPESMFRWRQLEYKDGAYSVQESIRRIFNDGVEVKKLENFDNNWRDLSIFYKISYFCADAKFVFEK